jgi:hypothetical protein
MGADQSLVDKRIKIHIKIKAPRRTARRKTPFVSVLPSEEPSAEETEETEKTEEPSTEPGKRKRIPVFPKWEGYAIEEMDDFLKQVQIDPIEFWNILDDPNYTHKGESESEEFDFD